MGVNSGGFKNTYLAPNKALFSWAVLSSSTLPFDFGTRPEPWIRSGSVSEQALREQKRRDKERAQTLSRAPPTDKLKKTVKIELN